MQTVIALMKSFFMNKCDMDQQLTMLITKWMLDVANGETGAIGDAAIPEFNRMA